MVSSWIRPTRGRRESEGARGRPQRKWKVCRRNVNLGTGPQTKTLWFYFCQRRVSLENKITTLSHRSDWLPGSGLSEGVYTGTKQKEKGPDRKDGAEGGLGHGGHNAE